MPDIDACLGQGASDQQAAMAVERIGLGTHCCDAMASAPVMSRSMPAWNEGSAAIFS